MVRKGVRALIDHSKFQMIVFDLQITDGPSTAVTIKNEEIGFPIHIEGDWRSISCEFSINGRSWEKVHERPEELFGNATLHSLSRSIKTLKNIALTNDFAITSQEATHQIGRSVTERHKTVDGICRRTISCTMNFASYVEAGTTFGPPAAMETCLNLYSTIQATAI
jgi:hypothetical protein